MYKIENIVDGTAKAYYLAYLTLIEKHHEVSMFYNDDFSVYIFPAITIAAFSCELALKNLIFNECEKTIKGHELAKLFKELSIDKQNLYRDATIDLYNSCSKYQRHNANIDENDFEKLLLANSNCFVEWRYLYEGCKKADLDFLEAFMFAVNDCQNEYADFISKTRKS